MRVWSRLGWYYAIVLKAQGKVHTLMKKLLFVALFALSMFATGTNKHDNPLPSCDPCPWVR